TQGSMTRQQQITKYVTKAMRGIEVAPWHSPIVPRREGFNCVTLDVFDTATLRRRAKDDPQVDDALIERIEDVEIVGSAVDIELLVEARGELGTFDYIISSHNFEHLPNPVKFLQGCSRVLKPEGILSMALPDKRGCFDYFKPHSTTADFIEAFFENRTKPRAAQVFLSKSLHATYGGDAAKIVFEQSADPSHVSANQELEKSFAAWRARRESGDDDYVDTHCWAFTPCSFCLLALELRRLELSRFDLLEATGTGGAEFFVHLRNSSRTPEAENFYELRHKLLHGIQNETAENTMRMFSLKRQLGFPS
ncbi:MAG TPA: methyltransferase domain-containing protein, partial [Rudaea sp.]|nr:methyltransferase domain-containing protein [Rudaea sp.]